MMASLLDGNLASLPLKRTLKQAVETLSQQGQRPPSLAVVLVGDDPASTIYVTNKHKACLEMGFTSYAYHLPQSTPEKKLLQLIDELNQSPKVDGILVQLPLPKGIDPHKVIEGIDPCKDVDGFHPYNLGRLAQRNPLLRPCTPYGITQLLHFYQIPMQSQHAVVVGASNIVGRPMALEFLLAGATVTVCHRLTNDLDKYIRMANLLVVATGIPDLVSVEWLNETQVIIDVGIHRLPNGKLRGDLDFSQAKERVAWITPVPGGVGPMTIATLLQNTLFAARQLMIMKKQK